MLIVNFAEICNIYPVTLLKTPSTVASPPPARVSFFNSNIKILGCWWVPVGMWAKASISTSFQALLEKRGKRSRSPLAGIVHISTGTKLASDEMLAVKLPCSVYGRAGRALKKVNFLGQIPPGVSEAKGAAPPSK